MAIKKASKKQQRRASARGRVIFSTHLEKDGAPWYQAGPLWLQSPPFSETDPFKETMSRGLAGQARQAKQQGARALELLKRVTKKR